MYYVYEWFIVSTGEIIYVGKGTRHRYKVRKHNKFFNDMIKRFECDSRIVKEFQSEAEAFEYEYVRIKELKEIGQCVCNINKGGSGGTTEWWTPELRKAYSENNVMKSESQRKRMTDNNPMKNSEISQKVSSQKQRAVIIGDTEYDSVKDACLALGVYHDTVALWCKKGINADGQLCRYKDSEQVVPSKGRYNKGGCRAMTYKGKHYESPIDLSRELGIPNNTVLGWLKRGFDSNGNVCRYDDDTRELTYKPVNKPVIVNGTRYPSIKAARDALGVGRGVLEYYLKEPRKNAKYICEYDNQQPSRGNVDKSTSEGSTTNR